MFARTLPHCLSYFDLSLSQERKYLTRFLPQCYPRSNMACCHLQNMTDTVTGFDTMSSTYHSHVKSSRKFTNPQRAVHGLLVGKYDDTLRVRAPHWPNYCTLRPQKHTLSLLTAHSLLVRVLHCRLQLCHLRLLGILFLHLRFQLRNSLLVTNLLPRANL